MATNPKWWNDQHTSAWDRVKSAMKRDWEQTKADFSKRGRELDQDVDDTVKQMAGKQPIPPRGQPNVEQPSTRVRATKDSDWDSRWENVEPEYRYGVGARNHYASDNDWNDRVESKLKEEWNDLKTGRTWDEVKDRVRRGWDRGR